MLCTLKFKRVLHFPLKWIYQTFVAVLMKMEKKARETGLTTALHNLWYFMTTQLINENLFASWLQKILKS